MVAAAVLVVAASSTAAAAAVLATSRSAAAASRRRDLDSTVSSELFQKRAIKDEKSLFHPVLIFEGIQKKQPDSSIF